jgi:hypothetical protein
VLRTVEPERGEEGGMEVEGPLVEGKWLLQQ